ncbi:hypothetical protein Q8G50_34135, partial [Klebsiella pneumoniae]
MGNVFAAKLYSKPNCQAADSNDGYFHLRQMLMPNKHSGTLSDCHCGIDNADNNQNRSDSVALL